MQENSKCSTDTILRGERQSSSDLTGINLKGAHLTSSNLSGGDMRKATSIINAIFDSAIMCHKKIPDDKNKLKL
jgi:uncharacterized protein YjbI with pentapeptide repeats